MPAVYSWLMLSLDIKQTRLSLTIRYSNITRGPHFGKKEIGHIVKSPKWTIENPK